MTSIEKVKKSSEKYWEVVKSIEKVKNSSDKLWKVMRSNEKNEKSRKVVKSSEK